MDEDPEVRRLRLRVARLEARVEDLEQTVNLRRRAGQEAARAASTDESAPSAPPTAAEPLRTPPHVPPAPPLLWGAVHPASLPSALHAQPPSGPTAARGPAPAPVPPGWARPAAAAAPVPASPSMAAATSGPTETIAAAAGQRAAMPFAREAAYEPVPHWAPPLHQAPSFNLRDIEERFAGQALAWIGGLALVAAAVFFLSLAFSRGWITEPMRVAIGFVAAAAGLAVGALCFDRKNPLLGNVLTAAGLGIASITLFAATRGYQLMSPELGLAAALAAAIAAAVIAIRYDAPEVAVFGLVSALIAPPVMGASPTTLTLLFIAVTLVGTTAIALFRSWHWLPSIAFVLSAPQFASWLLGGADVTQALVGLAGYWLVNVVAAGGEEIRIRRDDLRPSSATLVLANAAFLTWGGYTVLTGANHPWLGLFIAVSSLAHLAIGLAFLRRNDQEHLFGNLVGGTGVALLALAAFEQLGAALVPVAWAAEGAALAWLAAKRLHRWSALASATLGILAVLHLLAVEYPLSRATLAGPVFTDPMVHAQLASLLAVVGALAVAGWFAKVGWIRSGLVATAAGLVGYAACFELGGPALIAALVVTALAALELDARIERNGSRPDLVRLDAWVPGVRLGSLAALVAGAVAILAFVVVAYPIAGVPVPKVPYTDTPAISLAILLAFLAIAGARHGTRAVRSVFAAAAVFVVAWSVPFELQGTPQVALLAVLLPLAVLGDRAIARLPDARRLAFLSLPSAVSWSGSGMGAAAWLFGLLVALALRLGAIGSWGGVHAPVIPFTDETALIAVILAGAAVAAAAWIAARAGQHLALLASLVPLAFAVPLEAHDDLTVVLWLALAGVAIGITRWGDFWLPLAALLATLLGASAVLVAFALVAPPTRLWVGEVDGHARAALLPAWWLGIAAVAGALLVLRRRRELATYRPALEVSAAAVGVYLASVAIVDPFARLVGGSVPTEELAKQAQVAMSVAWTAIGAVSLGIGLRSRFAMPRHIGFGLLALATAKVFVVDLAAMDVAYRALVLAGLGVLLLLSAWLFTHLRGPRAGTPGARGHHAIT